MNLCLSRAVALAASLVILAGCPDSRTSEHSAKRTDDIQRHARYQKDAVDAEDARLTTTMAMREREIRAKYTADRAAYVNASGQLVAARDVRRDQIQLQATRDKHEIDHETAEQLRNSPTGKAAEIEADAIRRKSEIDSTATGELAPISDDAHQGTAQDHQRLQDLTTAEAEEISALERERSTERGSIEDKKIAIDRWASDELAKEDTDVETPAP